MVCGYAFAQMESDRQVQAGFMAFISRLVMAVTGISTLIFLFLVIKTKWFNSLGKSGRRRHSKSKGSSKRHNPKLEKETKLYQNLLYISLLVFCLSFYTMQKYEAEKAKPDEIYIDPNAPV